MTIQHLKVAGSIVILNDWQLFNPDDPFQYVFFDGTSSRVQQRQRYGTAHSSQPIRRAPDSIAHLLTTINNLEAVRTVEYVRYFPSHLDVYCHDPSSWSTIRSHVEGSLRAYLTDCPKRFDGR